MILFRIAREPYADLTGSGGLYTMRLEIEMTGHTPLPVAHLIGGPPCRELAGGSWPHPPDWNAADYVGRHRRAGGPIDRDSVRKNVPLNPNHPEFGKGVTLKRVVPFFFDPRVFSK